MIVGMGIDITDIGRIEAVYRKYGQRFPQRILHAREIFDIPQNVAPFLAGRFAAKEACVKALGTGFAQGITPKMIEVAQNGGGAPELLLHALASDRAALLGARRCHISLSHERAFAIALVVLES